MSGEFIETWTLDLSEPRSGAADRENGYAPAGDIRILVGDSPADSEQSYREDSRLWRTLTDLVRGIPALLHGDRVSLELDAGEIHLTPVDGQAAIEVDQEIHGLPESVDVYEPHRIELAAFMQETYRAVRAWHEAAAVTDPAQPVAEWYRDLSDALDAAEAAMEQADIDIPE
jgi:hypothetical protein